MIRLFLIALASLASFLVIAALAFRLTADPAVAGWTAALLGLIGTPALLLLRKVWPRRAGHAAGQRRVPQGLFIVAVHEDRLVVTRPDGVAQSVNWPDLREVAVITHDAGPFQTDLWWQLTGSHAGSGCAYPGGATGETEALARLQKLPGFDNDTLLKALCSTTKARFSCWQAPEAGDRAAAQTRTA